MKKRKKYKLGLSKALNLVGESDQLQGLIGASGAAVGDMIDEIFSAPQDHRTHRMNSGLKFPMGMKGEIEGGETVEYPDDSVKQFEGPDHSQGGIDIDIPNGTNIFSKRIKINGKSVADRKKIRTDRIKRADKYADVDKFASNSKDRLTDVDEMLSKDELDIQEFIKGHMEPNYKMGGKVKYKYGKKAKFQDGGVDIVADADKDLDKKDPLAVTRFQKFVNTLAPNTLAEDGIFGPQTTKAFDRHGGMYSTLGKGADMLSKYIDVMPLDEFPDTPNVGGGADKEDALLNLEPNNALSDDDRMSVFNLLKDTLPDLLPNSGGSNDEEILNSPNTPGDRLGDVGTTVSGLSPLLVTLANRIGDDPNIDPYSGVGDEAVQEIRSAQGRVGRIADEQLTRNQARGRALMKSARGSSTSLNTLRGLEQSINAQTAANESQIFANEQQGLIQSSSQLASFLNQRDEVQARGRQIKDDNDRRDRDNFYTQINKDIGTFGTMLQKKGADLNTEQLNNDSLDLLNTMSEFGFKVQRGSDGKFKIVR